MIKKIEKKKGISEMVSYVILISIGLVMAFLIYAFLKTQIPNADNEKICPADTSISVKSVRCIGGKIELEVRNSGLQRVDDLIIKGRTQQNLNLPNVEMSSPGAGGFVALHENGAKHAGGTQLIDLNYYPERCTEIGTTDCPTTDICAGEFDCSKMDNLYGMCTYALNPLNYNLNCEWIPDDPNVPAGDGKCVGRDTCDKLDNDPSSSPPLKCQGATIGNCQWRTSLDSPPSNHYTIHSLEIKPERQQVDPQGKNQSVTCQEAVVNIDMPSNCLLYEVGTP